MTPIPQIRRALPAERVKVVATVTAAFADDSAWRFITNDEYERLSGHFAGALFDVRAARGDVWVSADFATVAMWDPPGNSDQSLSAEESWARYRALAGPDAYARFLAYRDAVAAASPAEPCWYLGVLATHPERQREGLATAVLAPVLGEADWAGLACCLETSTESNRRFYKRRGFTEPTAIALPYGPRTWWLRRPPASRERSENPRRRTRA